MNQRQHTPRLQVPPFRSRGSPRPGHPAQLPYRSPNRKLSTKAGQLQLTGTWRAGCANRSRHEGRSRGGTAPVYLGLVVEPQAASPQAPDTGRAKRCRLPYVPVQQVPRCQPRGSTPEAHSLGRTLGTPLVTPARVSVLINSYLPGVTGGTCPQSGVTAETPGTHPNRCGRHHVPCRGL